MRLVPVLHRLSVLLPHNPTTMHPKHPQILKDIFQKSITSVQPSAMIKNALQVTNCHLVIKGDSYPMQKPCYVVGFGKAVLGMAKELEGVLGKHLQRGIVNVPRGIFKDHRNLSGNSKIKFVEGARDNLPDEDAMRGAVEIKELVEGLQGDDLLIVLISGGGSALLPLPTSPITLQEKQTLIKDLARSGADIIELNSVRKQISQLKGGGLAQLASPARVVSLILSDVVGDPLDFIASGPTAPNASTNEEAVAILEKYKVTVPDSIKGVLKGSCKSGKLDNVRNYIIGNNQVACEGAKQQAIEVYGYETLVISTRIVGDVEKISRIYARIARNIAVLLSKRHKSQQLLKLIQDDLQELKVEPNIFQTIANWDFSNAKSFCLIFGGEPTVTVTGSGRGGRNQQLALAFSVQLNKLCDVESMAARAMVDISFLSGGTDGIDGPTDAAGAIGSWDLVDNCSRQNIKPDDYLKDNDAYEFFTRFEGGASLIKVGHTGTNVMDLHVMIIEMRK